MLPRFDEMLVDPVELHRCGRLGAEPCHLATADVQVVLAPAVGESFEALEATTAKVTHEARSKTGVLIQDGARVLLDQRGLQRLEIDAAVAPSSEFGVRVPFPGPVQLTEIKALRVPQARIEKPNPHRRENQSEGPHSPRDDGQAQIGHSEKERDVLDELLDPVSRRVKPDGLDVGRLEREVGERLDELIRRSHESSAWYKHRYKWFALDDGAVQICRVAEERQVEYNDPTGRHGRKCGNHVRGCAGFLLEEKYLLDERSPDGVVERFGSERTRGCVGEPRQ